MELLWAPETLIAIAFGYLMGSIPFGLILTRLAGLGDIRAIGSGNIGATNVLRTGNKGLAAATLLLDAGKAAAAVLIVRYFIPYPPLAYSFAGMAAFIGHIFPVWLGFKGGKGVATYIGAMLAMNWIVGVIFCAVWLFIAVLRRYSSLAALTAAATAPIFAYVAPGYYAALFGGETVSGAVVHDYYPSPHLAAGAAMMSALLIYKHWPNIRRLIEGTEPRIGSEKKPTTDAKAEG